jgi:hypothetical protein
MDFFRSKVSRSNPGSILKERVEPEIILTHRHGDAHQDHRKCRASERYAEAFFAQKLSLA